jgi:hypothetical protein
MFTKLGLFPPAQTHFSSHLPQTRLQTAEEFLVVLLRSLKSIDFQDMTPRSLCPAIIDRLGKAGFEQVGDDVLIERLSIQSSLLAWERIG